jgi:hypothetical protein
LARGYERMTAHAEAMLDAAMIQLIEADRLAGEEIEPPGPLKVELARRLSEDLNAPDLKDIKSSSGYSTASNRR